MKKLIVLVVVIILVFSTTVFAQNIEVLLNYASVIVNGKLVTEDTILYNGRVYVPIRTISESLNKEVTWDGNTKNVLIRDRLIPISTPPHTYPSSMAYADTMSTNHIDTTTLNVSTDVAVGNNLSIGTLTSDTTKSINFFNSTSGSISANRISGGTLSGVILNVDTNATIGSQLTIGSLVSDSVKSLNFHNSSSGVAKISYTSGGYLNLNAWGAVNITSPGGLVVNKLEVISPTATIYGKQIATLDDIENLQTEYIKKSEIKDLIKQILNENTN